MSSFPGCPHLDQRLCPASAFSGRKEFIKIDCRHCKDPGGLGPSRGHGGALNTPIHMLTPTRYSLGIPCRAKRRDGSITCRVGN